MKVTSPMTHINSNDGTEFTARSCAFIHPTEKDDQGRPAVCFVGFSRNLGELTPQEISARKDDLQVVELDNGRYTLCEMGNSSWAGVDLGF